MNQSEPFRSPSADSYGNAQFVGYQSNSAAATVSLVFGILSICTMCTCLFAVFSLPLSLVAIICGHAGRSNIRNSGGRLSGGGNAVAGLTLGYSTLAVAAMGVVYFMLLASNVPTTTFPALTADGAVEYQAAESEILSGAQQTGGSSTTKEAAQPLADHYLKSLQELDAMIAESEGQTPPAPTAYRVYVRRNQNSVVYLVYVPNLDFMEPEAQEKIQRNCWSIAHACSTDVVSEDGEVAVVLYGSWSPFIAFFSSADPENASAELEDVQVEMEKIMPFFSDVHTSEDIEEWGKYDRNSEAEAEEPEASFELKPDVSAEAEIGAEAEAEVGPDVEAEVDEADTLAEESG